MRIGIRLLVRIQLSDVTAMGTGWTTTGIGRRDASNGDGTWGSVRNTFLAYNGFLGAAVAAAVELVLLDAAHLQCHLLLDVRVLKKKGILVLYKTSR